MIYLRILYYLRTFGLAFALVFLVYKVFGYLNINLSDQFVILLFSIGFYITAFFITLSTPTVEEQINEIYPCDKESKVFIKKFEKLLYGEHKISRCRPLNSIGKLKNIGFNTNKNVSNYYEYSFENEIVSFEGYNFSTYSRHSPRRNFNILWFENLKIPKNLEKTFLQTLIGNKKTKFFGKIYHTFLYEHKGKTYFGIQSCGDKFLFIANDYYLLSNTKTYLIKYLLFLEVDYENLKKAVKLI